MFENMKSEDYMGMISWSKTSGSARALFGTEIDTANPIKLEICHAEENRELSRNWYFSKKQIVEIELSPIQWAEFLTSGNTSGVPCTIKYLNGERMSDPKSSTIMEDYNNEVEEQFDEFGKSFDKVAETLKEQIDSNKPMGKKALEELLRKVEILRTNTVANVNFVKDSFKEDMNKIVTKAKSEFNAYVENRIHEIGIESLKNDSVKFLEDN